MAPHSDLSRRSFMGSVAGLGAAATVSSSAVHAADRPKNLSEVEVSGGNGLNVIVIIVDTLRWDYLHCNGNERIMTPNLDALAASGVNFTNCYADGLPTIPSRRVMHTGMGILPEKQKWIPLSKGTNRRGGIDDITIAEYFGKAGYTTGFIVDTFHHFKPGMNFHVGFDSFSWVRGQEIDRWVAGPRDSVNPDDHSPPYLMNDAFRNNMTQYMLNTQNRTSEDDYFCARSCNEAARWIEDTSDNGPFMLFMDMFDPHEPWDAPPRFQKMYRDSYPYDRYLFGYGVDHDIVRAEDYPVLRDLYSAEVTFSDHCIGKLIDRVKKLGLWDNTVILFSTDHGTHLGEQGCVQKQASCLNSLIARVPTIIRHPDPGWSGTRIDGLTSHLDFTPTLLELADIRTNMPFDGMNMWDLVTGDREKLRDSVVSGYGNFGSVHTDKWHYFRNVWGSDPGLGPQLNDLESDPNEEVNVIDRHPDVVAGLDHILNESFEGTGG
jgi:arylsulfatase A-like enzyme